MTSTYCPPVALVFFNRTECTKRVMERLRQIRPAQLFLIADGPRRHKPEDSEKCRKTRQMVENFIDWPCDVIRDFADQNMGCGKRLPSGLNNVFKQVDRAIILEDDIVPDPSFFHFCSVLLDRYSDQPKIMQIGAYNRFQYAPSNDLSYFYSRFSDIWGWATWRRAWNKFSEFDATTWETIRKSASFTEACYSASEAEMRTFCLDRIFSGELSAWGMRWDTTKLLHNGLGIVPSKNLALNIGFGSEASHTVNPLNPHRFIKVHEITPPYTGPEQLKSDHGYDIKYNRKMFPNNVITEKIRSGILKLMGKK